MEDHLNHHHEGATHFHFLPKMSQSSLAKTFHCGTRHGESFQELHILTHARSINIHQKCADLQEHEEKKQ